ncbi:MAG: hypothetical protein ACP5M9_04450 [Candidatus Micrarchaeia archaeon]
MNANKSKGTSSKNRMDIGHVEGESKVHRKSELISQLRPSNRKNKRSKGSSNVERLDYLPNSDEINDV